LILKTLNILNFNAIRKLYCFGGYFKDNRKGRKERKGFDFLNREDRKKDKGRG